MPYCVRISLSLRLRWFYWWFPPPSVIRDRSDSYYRTLHGGFEYCQSSLTDGSLIHSSENTIIKRERKKRIPARKQDKEELSVGRSRSKVNLWTRRWWWRILNFFFLVYYTILLSVYHSPPFSVKIKTSYVNHQQRKEYCDEWLKKKITRKYKNQPKLSQDHQSSTAAVLHCVRRNNNNGSSLVIPALPRQKTDTDTERERGEGRRGNKNQQTSRSPHWTRKRSQQANPAVALLVNRGTGTTERIGVRL